MQEPLLTAPKSVIDMAYSFVGRGDSIKCFWLLSKGSARHLLWWSIGTNKSQNETILKNNLLTSTEKYFNQIIWEWE